jgi:GT2 family glycosyltransferase
VILSLGRADETAAAICSALAQTGVSRHVFIVDQGSRPDTLAQLGTLLAGRTDATLVALDHNHGVAGGRNRGIALGHGRTIYSLDNDAEFADPTTLARAVAALDSDPALAAIGCRIMLYAGEADDLSSWGYPASLLPRAAGAFDTVTFVGAGHAIRRSAWNACGDYDEALFFCWEEYDFCLRAIEQGWRIRYRGDIVVRHKVSPERRVVWSGSRWFHFVRNRLYIGRKWGSGRLLLLARFGFLPAHRHASRAGAADATRAASSDPSVIRRDGAAAFGCGARLSACERHRASRPLADQAVARRSLCRRQSRRSGEALAQQQRKDGRALDEVAPSQPPWIAAKPMQPFKVGVLHPGWRAFLRSGEEFQARADAKAAAVEPAGSLDG